MKKFLIICLALAFIGMTRIVGAEPTNPATEATPPAVQPLIVTIMDEVPVPEEILVRIQSVYVGYAVTQATQASKGGQTIYRLKIEHDNVPSEFKPVYLIYDMAWQFIEEEQWVPPAPVEVAPPPTEQPVQVEAAPAPAEEKPDKPDRDDSSPIDADETDNQPRHRDGSN